MTFRFKTKVIMVLHSFFFFITELWCIRKDSLVVACCLIRVFEFRVVLFLSWLPSREASPPWYSTRCWKWGKVTDSCLSQTNSCKNRMQQTRSALNLVRRLPLTENITVSLNVYNLHKSFILKISTAFYAFYKDICNLRGMWIRWKLTEWEEIIGYAFRVALSTNV